MGRDKAGIPFEGGTLASRAARKLAEVCDEVLVASGDGKRLASLGLRQVADATAERGPLGGIVAGLEAAGHPSGAPAAPRRLRDRCGHGLSGFARSGGPLRS